jgi:CDP-6-deoxy-D-xylo-4-hexulose-3-dehydrase
VMIAHTLGNPFDLAAVTRSRDATGCADRGLLRRRGRDLRGPAGGTFGDLATVSFYPAHHITMGEGGAVLTNSPALRTLAESFRDWGATAGASPGRTTPAASASAGSSATCRAATTTSTRTRTSATT